ncbi:hypothetical protein [uncultured Acetobacterium sp.]|uniref:hypothetical protein n=1 Tax=uncultured Acetobacterium sp. TaxID=217139 RepID=UPI0025F1F571|nr:hypothetical protein [uncultured Acetobacterium sp.]
MENEKKGIYGNADELGKRERDLGSGENPIYGEAEGAANANREDVRTFMADPDGRNPKVNPHARHTPVTPDPDGRNPKANTQIRHTTVTPDQTEGVYTQAGELAEIEKVFEENEDGIYSEAEELARNNTADMHNFMADSDGKK